MSCPICGANCRCKKRGPHGECCPCHRHKVTRVLIDQKTARTLMLGRSFADHMRWLQDGTSVTDVLQPALKFNDTES